MRRTLAALTLLPATALAQPLTPSLAPSLNPPPLPEAQNLRTVAEATNFRMTSVSTEVAEHLDALAEQAPLVRRLSLGKTHEGRPIPMVIVADPPVATAEEARAAAKAGRPTVLLFANIHAGECDGKEALGMLARELAMTASHPALKKFIVAIVPNYNADGNDATGLTEKMRPGQVGPEGVCGRRENSMGLDLNRDFIKLEAPETRALVGFMNAWDPVLIVDCHTTNGSLHQYLVTYAGPKAPATNPSLLTFSRETFLPDIARRFEAATGRFSFWYGNFEGEFGDAQRGHTRWETFPAEARFGTTYIGLRGVQSVLVESYSYATYKERVLGSLAYCRAVLDAACHHRDNLVKTVASANADKPAKLAIRSRMAAFPGSVTIRGFKESIVNGRAVSTGQAADYTVELWDHFVPALEVEVPSAYLIRKPSDKVRETLAAHGVIAQAVTKSAEREAQIYTIRSAAPSSRPFQNHIPLTLDAERRDGRVKAEPGDLMVKTDQPLGRLAVYLLEPMSEDGLATWNFFDDACKPGAEFPIVRIP